MTGAFHSSSLRRLPKLMVGIPKPARVPAMACKLELRPLSRDGATDDAGENPHQGEKNITSSHRQSTRTGRLAAFKWWSSEYRWAVACITGLVILSVILWHFDGKLSPDLGPVMQLDMVIIAIMTLVRVALGSIVESCICQGAWIWFSKSHQTRAQRHARLEDFKLFNEASRGLLGSLSLLWRLRGLSAVPFSRFPSLPADHCLLDRHLSCVGALIIIVTHGFETFSQQLFVYVQEPTIHTNDMSRPAPAPFRSDY
ncbi:arginase family protein [Purpureocillium lavendulum]|uniref:Arginase family protein n=1 Tax=Purpureocillium lavendulum TaxID=1247861 RepID=A0AB34FWT1_9HYPO|nr:arginase family protein [Purpureocillium lavendulum]